MKFSFFLAARRMCHPLSLQRYILTQELRQQNEFSPDRRTSRFRGHDVKHADVGVPGEFPLTSVLELISVVVGIIENKIFSRTGKQARGVRPGRLIHFDNKWGGVGQLTFWTFCERRHRVQTFTRFGLPSITTRIVLRFGRNMRLVFRFEWLTVFPETGPFPQISHLYDMTASSLRPAGAFITRTSYFTERSPGCQRFRANRVGPCPGV
jgi:hypothetical protein